MTYNLLPSFWHISRRFVDHAAHSVSDSGWNIKTQYCTSFYFFIFGQGCKMGSQKVYIFKKKLYV